MVDSRAVGLRFVRAALAVQYEMSKKIDFSKVRGCNVDFTKEIVRVFVRVLGLSWREKKSQRPQCWCHNVGFTMLISQCWFHNNSDFTMLISHKSAFMKSALRNPHCEMNMVKLTLPTLWIDIIKSALWNQHGENNIVRPTWWRQYCKMNNLWNETLWNQHCEINIVLLLNFSNKHCCALEKKNKSLKKIVKLFIAHMNYCCSLKKRTKVTQERNFVVCFSNKHCCALEEKPRVKKRESNYSFRIWTIAALLRNEQSFSREKFCRSFLKKTVLRSWETNKDSKNTSQVIHFAYALLLLF